MNIVEALPGLMVIYLCIGVIVGTCLAIYFIHKDAFDREAFTVCAEAVLYYGPALLVLTCKGLNKLAKFLATRDYKGWKDRQVEDFLTWNRARKKLNKQTRDFKTRQKAKK